MKGRGVSLSRGFLAATILALTTSPAARADQLARFQMDKTTGKPSDVAGHANVTSSELAPADALVQYAPPAMPADWWAMRSWTTNQDPSSLHWLAFDSGPVTPEEVSGPAGARTLRFHEPSPGGTSGFGRLESNYPP